MTENELIKEYASSHQNISNQKIHYLCVPIIVFSIISFLYIFTPVYVVYTVFLLTLFYYYRFLNSYFSKMVIFMTLILLIAQLTKDLPYFLEVNLGLFILAWVGQFWGHRIEGKNPSFFKNLLFLLVGPAWVAHKLSKKMSVETR